MLQVDRPAYQYGTHKVLSDLAFCLSHGQVALLVGQNGAGKSTLLRCIAGWTSVNDGRISINGISCQDQDRNYRKQIVFVPDTPDFYDAMTAWEHLQFIAQLHRIPSWRETGKQLLKKFQIFDHKDYFPFTLSRGMRYKLALCLALLVEPPLLMLDEPFGPLDALASQTLGQVLHNYAAGGKSVLFSSHTIPAAGYPDVILHLNNGQIDTIQPSHDTDLTELLNDAG